MFEVQTPFFSNDFSNIIIVLTLQCRTAAADGGQFGSVSANAKYVVFRSGVVGVLSPETHLFAVANVPPLIVL